MTTAVCGAQAAAVMGAALMASPAQARGAARGRQTGDLVTGFGSVGVLPEAGGRVDAIGGKSFACGTAAPRLGLTSS